MTHEPLERGVDVPVGDRQIRRVFFEDRRHRLAGRVALEGALARQHLVQDHAQSEDVAPRIGGLGLDLLGRHVTERSHDHPRLGCRREAGGSPGVLSLGQFRQAEVEDLDAALPGHEEVLGFQVAVDDAFFVSGRQAVGDLDRVVDCPARREAPSGDLLAQRLAFQQLLDDLGSALVLAGVVDDRDVGVVENSGRAGLLFEALEAVRVLR